MIHLDSPGQSTLNKSFQEWTIGSDFDLDTTINDILAVSSSSMDLVIKSVLRLRHYFLSCEFDEYYLLEKVDWTKLKLFSLGKLPWQERTVILKKVVVDYQTLVIDIGSSEIVI